MRTITPSVVTGEFISGRSFGTNEPVREAGVIGVRATIYPPVDLNPAAVERHGCPSGVLKNTMLLGSSEEGTVLYADLSRQGRPWGTEGQALASVAQTLLGLMGLKSQIVEAT